MSSEGSGAFSFGKNTRATSRGGFKTGFSGGVKAGSHINAIMPFAHGQLVREQYAKKNHPAHQQNLDKDAAEKRRSATNSAFSRRFQSSKHSQRYDVSPQTLAQSAK